MTVANSVEDANALLSEWTRLRKRCSTITTWTHPDRFFAELAASPQGVDAYVAVFRDESSARALIIGRTSIRPVTCAVGYFQIGAAPVRRLDVVYGGLFSDGTSVAHRAILRHFRLLLRQQHFDMITINHLPVKHDLYARLRGDGALMDKVEPHWRFTLVPGSYQDTIAQVSKKHRYNMRRADRLLVEHFDGDVAIRLFDGVDDLDVFMRAAASIAGRTYQGGMGVGFVASRTWRAILGGEARNGRLRCYWLEGGGEPIAFQVGVVYEGVYFLEFIGYLPENASLSPGAVLHARVLRDLCSAGVRTVDYGFGDAEYKRVYGSHSCDETTLYLFGRSSRAMSALILLSASTRASGMALRCVRWLGLASWLKRRWRTRLAPRADSR